MSIVKINALTVDPDNGSELEQRFAHRQHAVDSAPGFEGFQLLRPTNGGDRYFVVTQWADEESYNAWRDAEMSKGGHGGGHGAHGGDKKPVATGSELLEFEVVLGSIPQ